MEALDAAGRRDEAATLAQRFILQNADSPLADRARGFLAGSKAALPRNQPSTP
jgi:hypothetical protein